MNEVAGTADDVNVKPEAASGHERLGASLLSLWACAVALAVLVGFAALGLHPMWTPAAVPATAEPGVFSAQRAMAYVNHVASKPHPLGSREDQEVRDYLVMELQALGATPEVQTTLAVSSQRSVVGYVSNIIARIPGSGRGKALMLLAHYDSVSTAPGAADDGASVSAILETIRALHASPPLRNDLIVLFTDGEEPGSLGAEAFMAEHPWAHDVGVVLNFEFRGNSGPMLMFESSAHNGKLIQALAQVSHPVADSLMGLVYGLMPNRTDLSVVKDRGILGLNFAAMERPFSYHTALDRPELLDQRSLQHEGDSMLALARHFGSLDLDQLAAPQRIYFNTPGLGLVSYTEHFARQLGGLIVLLWGGVLWVGFKTRKIRVRHLLGAIALLPVLGLLIAGVSTLVWVGITLIHPQYRVLPDVYNAEWYRLGLAALAAGLFIGAQSLLLRWFRAIELAVGATSFWALAAVITSCAFPGASYLFVWPLLPILATWMYLLSKAGERLSDARRLPVLVIAAAPAVMLCAPVLDLLFVGLTTSMCCVPAFVLVLLMGILWPALALMQRNRLLRGAALTVACGFFVMGSLTAGESHSHPYQDTLFYLQYPKPASPQWISTNRVLDSWQKDLFGQHPQRHAMPELFGSLPRRVWSAPAADIAVPVPVLSVMQDQIDGPIRHLKLHLLSVRQAPVLTLNVSGATVLEASWQGHPLMTAPRKDWSFAAYAMPVEGVDLTMSVPSGQPFMVHVFDKSYGLPPHIVAPRGPGLIAQGYGESDSVQALTSMSFH